MASVMRQTCTIAATSWTRTMSAPWAMAIATVAAVPSRRSSTGRPSTAPMVDLREVAPGFQRRLGHRRLVGVDADGHVALPHQPLDNRHDSPDLVLNGDRLESGARRLPSHVQEVRPLPD